MKTPQNHYLCSRLSQYVIYESRTQIIVLEEFPFDTGRHDLLHHADLRYFGRHRTSEAVSQSYIGMASRIPMARYSMTTETIFRSNIETIRTIGNILFVEAVSSFYDLRENYKAIVIEDFQNQSNSLLFLETLRDLNTPSFIFYSEAFLRSMKVDFENCKQLMKVTDEDLEVFSRQKEKLMESTRSKMHEDIEESSSDRNERSVRLQQALEQGEKN